MTTTAKIKAAIISQLFSVFTHAYLTNSHYRLKFGLADGKSLCNISDLFNCDAVAASPFAQFLGTPLALGGLLFNLFLMIALVWYLYFPQKYLRRQIQIFSGVIAAVSVVMAIISTSMLSTYCLFCLFTYLFSFVTFSLTMTLPEPAESTDSFFTGAGLKWFLFGLLGLPALTIFANSVIKTNLAQDFDRQVKVMINSWLTESNANITNVKGLVLGADPSTAKMLIVEFADYQCIHCKMAAPSVKNFVKSRNDVSLIYVPFPLDGQCNSAITQSGNGRSCVLAASAMCADIQGKGWQVSDWIFDNFGKFELAELTTFIESTGINMEQFRTCREAPETNESLRANAKIGELAGVKGTPSFFVNGRQLSGAQFIPVLEAAYDKIKSK